MNLTFASLALIGLGILFSAGCLRVIDCPHGSASREYEELVKTIAPSNAVAVQRFSEYSVNTQVKIFLYARDCRGDPRFRPMLIENGEGKVPTIVERIKTEVKIYDKQQLAGVLLEINAECRCISKDSDVIKTLEDVGHQLDNDRTVPADDAYKQLYISTVQTLKAQSDQK